MPSTKVLIGVGVCVACVLSAIMVYMTTRPKDRVYEVSEIDERPPTKKKAPQPKPARPPPPPPPAPTQPPPPTTAPAAVTTMVYPDYAAGLIPPMPYPVVMPTPSYILVPGANFPGLVGRHRDDATSYIITRYPRLVVRAVPVGSPMTYEVRKDRVTVSYDPYTNRVVSARIG